MPAAGRADYPLWRRHCSPGKTTGVSRIDGSALAIRRAVSGPPAPECQPRSLGAMRERLFCSLCFFAAGPGARDRRFGVPERRTGAVIRGVREPVIGEVAARQPASAVVSSMSNPSRNSLVARLDLST